MTDLSLVSMDDIWEELKKRNDAVVLIDLKSHDEQRESSQISYKGGQFTCLGMVQKAAAYLISQMLAPSTKEGEH